MRWLTLKSPHLLGRRSFFLVGPPGLLAECGLQVIEALRPWGENSSHGISCNMLPAKLIQIGLDMNI